MKSSVEKNHFLLGKLQLTTILIKTTRNMIRTHLTIDRKVLILIVLYNKMCLARPVPYLFLSGSKRILDISLNFKDIYLWLLNNRDVKLMKRLLLGRFEIFCLSYSKIYCQWTNFETSLRMCYDPVHRCQIWKS